MTLAIVLLKKGHLLDVSGMYGGGIWLGKRAGASTDVVSEIWGRKQVRMLQRSALIDRCRVCELEKKAAAWAAVVTKTFSQIRVVSEVPGKARKDQKRQEQDR